LVVSFIPEGMLSPNYDNIKILFCYALNESVYSLSKPEEVGFNPADGGKDAEKILSFSIGISPCLGASAVDCGVVFKIPHRYSIVIVDIAAIQEYSRGEYRKSPRYNHC
jgi:hypothetical protein